MLYTCRGQQITTKSNNSAKGSVQLQLFLFPLIPYLTNQVTSFSKEKFSVGSAVFVTATKD
jgi:hypothetical protein